MTYDDLAVRSVPVIVFPELSHELIPICCQDEGVLFEGSAIARVIIRCDPDCIAETVLNFVEFKERFDGAQTQGIDVTVGFFASFAGA